MQDFTLLVLPGAFSSSVCLSLDILASAAALAPRIGCATPRWRVVAPQGKVALEHGISLSAQKLSSITPDGSDTWIIPGLGTATPSAVKARLKQADALEAIAALQNHVERGGSVAASCSAVFLLQAAGLLVDKTVTTTWWLAPHLQTLEPRCGVDADRMVIADGKLITAGAALAQTDLMLHLLRSRFGPALTEAISRSLLIDGRQSQAQYIVPSMLANGNEFITKLLARFESALPQPPSISSLAAEFKLSERSFARHVHTATGRSTSALLQGVRLSKARMLLETTSLSVEQIAAQVGYGDATALRRLMRKTMGATPRQFRSSR